MMHAMSRLRFPLLALGMVSLLTALLGGLVRLGWTLPVPTSTLLSAHGPLMVCGFLGTLIGVERAVALGRRWLYVGPALTGLGGVALLLGFPAATLMTLGSVGLLAIFGVVLQRQCTLATGVMSAGAVLWLLGNGLWFCGWPLYQVAPWWTGFLVVTIAGERLELSHILHLSQRRQAGFVAAVGLYVAGIVVSAGNLDAGARLAGAGMLALAAWLLGYDIARRTVRQRALTRFIAVCLLSGYVWLGIGGILSLWYGGTVAGPYYDAILHAIFLGFVFAMIFGHAPVIFPAVFGATLPYHPILYAPLVLLHASLCLRLLGDLHGWPSGRPWGGLGNAIAIGLFFVLLGQAMWRGRHPGGAGHLHVSTRSNP